MNKNLYNIKNELLCYGVRITSDALLYINRINPYINNKSIHAANFFIGDKIYINMQFNEQYNFRSPYLVHYVSDSLYLIRNDIMLCEIRLVPPPPWYELKTNNDVYMHNVFNVHGDNVLALSNYEGCSYLKKGVKCKFCSFIPNELFYTDLNYRINDIVETLKCAFKYKPNYSIALSEGTKNGDDRGALSFSKISKSIIDNLGNKKISAELAPPKDNKYIDYMIENGITSIIMNIELYDDTIRQNICPGKSEIPIEHYMNSLSYAVKRLGIGNVSSVLIAGLEPTQNTIECAKRLLHIGVIPTIIPFKPYDNCELRNKGITSPYIIQEIQNAIEKEVVEIKFPTTIPHACIACGACNAVNLI